MYDELSSNDRPRKILTEAERNAGPNHSYEILMKQVDDKITEYMKFVPRPLVSVSSLKHPPTGCTHMLKSSEHCTYCTPAVNEL